MITKKQYEAARADLGPEAWDYLHNSFYLQFANPRLRSRVCGAFSPEELLNSDDPYLNDLALARWDDLARSSYPFMPHEEISAAGTFYSLSFGVCLLKAIAKDIKSNLQTIAA